jgi:pilus assembly protein CpaB
MKLKLNLNRLNGLRKVRPGKTWVVLGVALGVGLLAALAARTYLTHQMAVIEARAKGKAVAVVVAKRDLAKGSKLSGDNLAVREIPEEYAHSAGVTPDSFERVDGQVLAYPLKSGEMLLWGLIESQKAPTFSARVESGHRAMTVPVDEINSISGMLEPGDMIDLMVTLDQNGKKITFPLLQSVQVMATGQRAVDDAKSGERRQFSTVTLDTTPEQAQNVIVARDSGKLTALLRNPQDSAPVGNGGYDLAALLGQNGVAAKAAAGEQRPPAPRVIPVLYGGSMSRTAPEALSLGQPSATAAAAPAPRGTMPGGAPATP